MKATYEIFKDIALIFISENVSPAEVNSLLLLTTKLGEVGVKQVIVDVTKSQPDSQAVQTLLTAKPKLRNAKTPQGLFVSAGSDSIGDFKTIIEAIDRFPSGEGLKVKELYALRGELEDLVANLKAVDGVLKMPGSIEQKQKSILQKNNYLKRIHANLDAELAWLNVEIKAFQSVPKPSSSSVAPSEGEINLKAYFSSILNPPAQGGA